MSTRIVTNFTGAANGAALIVKAGEGVCYTAVETSLQGTWQVQFSLDDGATWGPYAETTDAGGAGIFYATVGMWVRLAVTAFTSGSLATVLAREFH